MVRSDDQARFGDGRVDCRIGLLSRFQNADFGFALCGWRQSWSVPRSEMLKIPVRDKRKLAYAQQGVFARHQGLLVGILLGNVTAEVKEPRPLLCCFARQLGYCLESPDGKVAADFENSFRGGASGLGWRSCDGPVYAGV